MFCSVLLAERSCLGTQSRAVLPRPRCLQQLGLVVSGSELSDIHIYDVLCIRLLKVSLTGCSASSTTCFFFLQGLRMMSNQFSGSSINRRPTQIRTRAAIFIPEKTRAFQKESATARKERFFDMRYVWVKHCLRDV